MSVSYIPVKTKMVLWGRAGGRCQYRGCNQPLWEDSLTRAEFNTAYIAHIVADKPNGPRGDTKLSEKLKSDLSNLMILCDVHHRLVDIQKVDEHPVEVLKAMKHQHEERVTLLGSLQPNRRSEVLLYGARIGEHGSMLSFDRASQGMLPDWYPASRDAIQLGMVNSTFEDRESEFWQVESKNLRRLVKDRVKQRLELGDVQHLSIFGLAPQPLLILLGSLLTDIPSAEVYHLFREPADWRWREHPDDFELVIRKPTTFEGPPALVLALTATVTNDRIASVLGPDAAVWTLTVPQPKHDAISSRHGLSQFRKELRLLLDEIKAKHGQDAELNVFPAMGVSTAIELGRVRQPKADMPFHIYDQNLNRGGFRHALNIGPEEVLDKGGL